MIYYWGLSFFIFFVGVFEFLFNKVKKTKPIMSYFYITCVLSLIIFGGIRSPGTGIDDMQYIDFFNDINGKLKLGGFFSTISQYRYEPLMYLLFEVASFFSSNAAALIFFILRIISISEFIFYKKAISISYTIPCSLLCT